MIPLYHSYSDQSDVDAVAEVIRGGMYWAEGPKVAEFEQKLAAYMGVKHAVCVNSGTSALHLALLACGIGPGDEVIVPSFTFIATANAVLMSGAKPVFADITETCGLDPNNVEERIHRHTKAIIAVHYAGCPCDIQALRDLANGYGLKLIEDNAEAMGAEVNGKKTGTFGDCGILSFCANKIISTGEGGAVISDNEETASKVRMLRSHGRVAGSVHSGEVADYTCLGYNYRMSDIQGALGISQLKKINELIECRREVACEYSSTLGTAYHPESVFQLYTINAKDRDGLQQRLTDSGISSKVYFHPVHQTPFYRSLGYTDSLPVTERISSEVLSLPMYPSLKPSEIEYICEKVKEGLNAP